MTAGKIALAEMVQELRRELQAAVDAGRGAEIRFGVGEVTLELEVAVAREAGAEGGLRFWVLGEAKGSAKAATTRTQTLTLRLTPEGPGGERLRASAQRRGKADGA